MKPGARVRVEIILILLLWIVPSFVSAEEGDLSADPGNGEIGVCGPYPQLAQLDTSDRSAAPGSSEAGVRPSASVSSRGEGNIVSLPTVGSPRAADTRPGDETESEALLALPKDSSGAVADDFVLGVGARVSDSFFSPVICSTVARVKGPAGASPAQLVVVVPDGGIVVANDVYYASAAAEVRALESETAAAADPYTALQYGLAVTGVRYARELGDGGGVRVALLDSAPESSHEDLAGVEVQPISESAARSLKTGVHGTLMAGIISAVENNGYGIAGVAPGADLIAIPICQPDGGAGGRCSIYHMLRGLDLAWEADAQILNLSLSGPPNPLLERGVARLDELGVVVVAAAGNEGIDEPRFPAAYQSVIGVGAVDRDGKRFELSNRGSWVELSAPGVEVLSTVPGNAFAFGSGTSLAAAHVTGFLAVLTGLTKDPKIAKAELFRAANSQPRSLAGSVGLAPGLPKICSVFSRLGRDCSDAGVGDAAP